jgi:hypothetical protein
MVKKSGIKIYKTKPVKGSGWEPTDPARSAEQAKEMVKIGYGDADAIAVKTGNRGDVFPYTIYTKLRRVSIVR